MTMFCKINWVDNTAVGHSGAMELLNRFFSAEAYRAIAKPDRQTDGGAKLRLRRVVTSLKWMRLMRGCALFVDVRDGAQHVHI